MQFASPEPLGILARCSWCSPPLRGRDEASGARTRKPVAGQGPAPERPSCPAHICDICDICDIGVSHGRRQSGQIAPPGPRIASSRWPRVGLRCYSDDTTAVVW